MKNGTLIHSRRANRAPASSGLTAAPSVRATPVMPAAAERSWLDTKPQVEPVGGEALDHKAASERIQGKQRRELPDGVSGVVHAGEGGKYPRVSRSFDGVRFRIARQLRTTD